MKLTTPDDYNQYQRNDDFEELLSLVEYTLRSENKKQLDYVTIIIKGLYTNDVINDVIKRYVDIGWSKVESHDITDHGKEYTYFRFVF